jgi:D-beta-D-heptose 7-phosphate kinase/D-beta-D-heptose 1-phosphate adenosyltransferase
MPTTLSKDRLASLLEAARGKRIVVVGDAMLDVYLRGDVDRISPEAPVPVVRVRDRRAALGGAANVAQNVVALGASCELIALIGKDRAGGQLTEFLAMLGVDSSTLVVSEERRTTTKTRILARNQQVIRFDEEDDEDVSAAEASALTASMTRALENADALILEDYNKGVLVLPLIERAMAVASRRKIPIIVDPKYKNFFAYRGATIFKPNRRELESALGATMDIEHADAMPVTLARLGAQHLLLTLGEAGMALFSADGSVYRVATTAREVYDVSGAGDTVTATLAALMAAGATAREAASIANFAAGIEVGKLGAATVSPEEILAAHGAFQEAGR